MQTRELLSSLGSVMSQSILVDHLVCGRNKITWVPERMAQRGEFSSLGENRMISQYWNPLGIRKWSLFWFSTESRDSWPCCSRMHFTAFCAAFIPDSSQWSNGKHAEYFTSLSPDVLRIQKATRLMGGLFAQCPWKCWKPHCWETGRKHLAHGIPWAGRSIPPKRVNKVLWQQNSQSRVL